MKAWFSKLKTTITSRIKDSKKDLPKVKIDIRCRLGQHDFFDPASEQPTDAWFMEDIQRFHEQHPIQKGRLYCKRCGMKKARRVGVIFDSLPFMIRF